MNEQELKIYRFIHLGGRWYIKTLKEPYKKYQEQKRNK